MTEIKARWIQYGIAIAFLLFILFFIGIWLDDEFLEPQKFFYKFPPTIEWEMWLRNSDETPLSTVMRYEHYYKVAFAQGPFTDISTTIIMQLFLAILFIKPVLPRKVKYILIDVLLFSVGYLLSIMTYGLFYRAGGLVWHILFFSTILIVNFLIFRVLRPAKKYS